METIAAFASVWTDRLPEDSRDQADEILIDAARSGADLRDLNALGAEIYAKSRPALAGNDHAGHAPRVFGVGLPDGRTVFGACHGGGRWSSLAGGVVWPHPFRDDGS